MTTRFGLKESTIEKICGTLARFPQVEKAVLYGSRATADYKESSDIDLTLYGDDDLTPEIVYEIDEQLDDLMLPYTFDLSIFKRLGDPDFIQFIQQVGIVFYKRE
jgi:predicted nucleotidyltransferase